MFPRSLTVATLQPKASAATEDSVTDSSLRQGQSNRFDGVPTAPQEQETTVTSEDVVVAARNEKVKEAVHLGGIKRVLS